MGQTFVRVYAQKAASGIHKGKNRSFLKNFHFVFTAKNGGYTPGGYTPGITVFGVNILAYKASDTGIRILTASVRKRFKLVHVRILSYPLCLKSCKSKQVLKAR